MMSREEFAPNERLRHARNLKGWSQAELAEEVGTSFEMVSRWERGVTVPSPYYRERLCVALGKTAEELGLIQGGIGAFTRPPSPLVLLACSHEDAEKAIVSHLKIALQELGITPWSSRQLARQGTGNTRTILREVVRAAQVILVIVSPEARSSRHVRETLEMARRYQRPVYGVWIEGEDWQECLPKGSGELVASIDARGRDDAILLEETAIALERMGLGPHNIDTPASTESETRAPTVQPRNLYKGLQVFHEEDRDDLFGRAFLAEELSAAATPVPADVPLLPKPTTAVRRRGVTRTTATLLIGLVALVVVGGILGSVGLLAHFGLFSTHSGATMPIAVRGGTWVDESFLDPDSFIPNGTSTDQFSSVVDQALYLPLFYGDAQGVVHPGAATEVPTVQNGGVNVDATTWTFHLRPHLVWSDGQPYDARDVDFTWKLWLNQKFGGGSIPGLNLISRTDISADHLTITFHLKQAYAPFLVSWVDGFHAPLPAHHFSSMPPEQILKSPDNLNPKVTSGPFMMEESVPGDHYTVVRNPRYYRASEGLPYLDKVVFRIVAHDVIPKDLQAGSTTSTEWVNIENIPEYQRLTAYTLIPQPASSAFEAMYFNFHNRVLASHLEVRQAMAMAVDQQAIIAGAIHGFGNSLCTDHPSAYHPGYDPNVSCPVFDLAVANKLLDDNGWVKGADGVRTKGSQRLEFEYSTNIAPPWRLDIEAILQRDFGEIGIKLDIQNYKGPPFFNLLFQGQASPPTGAIVNRYDIAEFDNGFWYDPDDASLLACDQFPPNGTNIDFYCNPALDALYKEEQEMADPGVRQQIFEKIHHIYLTEFPFIVLYSQSFPYIVHKGTHNYQPSPFDIETANIWEWWCDHGQC